MVPLHDRAAVFGQQQLSLGVKHTGPDVCCLVHAAGCLHVALFHPKLILGLACTCSADAFSIAARTYQHCCCIAVCGTQSLASLLPRCKEATDSPLTHREWQA